VFGRLAAFLMENPYQPSGRVSVARFLPLLLLSMIVAVVMAVVLCLSEANWYFFIITPFVLSLPVFGMLLVTIQIGRCRNRIVGSLAGLLLLSLYYGGYWLISYGVNVVGQGPEAVEYVRLHGGAPGIVGYFHFRCKQTVIESTPGVPNEHKHKANDSDAVGAYLFYGLELLLIPGAGFLAGRSRGGRVFYENVGRWSSSIDLRFAGSEFATVYDTVLSADWTPLAKLARLPRFGGGGAGSSFTILKLEYLPAATDQPVYVTISGTNLGKNPAAKAAGAKGLAGISKTFVRQHEVSAATAQALPEFAATTGTPKAGTTPQPMLPEKRPSIFRGALEKAGIIGKAGGPDFRENAVKVSQVVLASSPRSLNPADINRSLCLPADANPSAKLKSAAWYDLKMVSAAAVLMFCGVILAAVSESPKDSGDAGRKKENPVLLATGATLFVVGGIGFAGILVGGNVLRKRSMIRTLCRRPGALFGAEAKGETMVLRMEDAHTFHQLKSTPQDIGVCLFDADRRRLLVEGICHRYVICGSDVTKLTLLDAGTTTALQLNYRIGNDELALALTTTGLGRQALVHSPLLMWLAPRSGKKLLERFRRTLSYTGLL
jgi:hypothetical protein